MTEYILIRFFAIETVRDCIFNMESTVLYVGALLSLSAQLEQIARKRIIAWPTF